MSSPTVPATWNTIAPEQRIAHFGKYIVNTPSLMKSVEFIRAHKMAHDTAPEGEFACLVGETRSGKTTAVDTFIEEVAEETGGEIVTVEPGDGRFTEAVTAVVVQTPFGLQRPVVKITVPNHPGLKGMMGDVLTAFDARVRSTATRAERELTLGKQLRGQGTKLLIFDEMQHMCEKTGSSSAYGASEIFKVLAKVGRVQILGCGLEESLEVLDANPQIAWLGGSIHMVKPLALTADPSSDLAHYMAALSEMLPFDQPSELTDPEVFVPLALYCDGFEGRMSNTIRKAVAFAISEDQTSLSRQTFIEVLRTQRRVPDGLNPFLTLDDPKTYRAKIAKTEQDRARSAEIRRSSGMTRLRKPFGTRGK